MDAGGARHPVPEDGGERAAPPPAAREAAARPPGEATAILTRAVAERLRARPAGTLRQGSRRVALALYVILLVLPTAVLGGLHWYQLRLDHRALVAAVPGEASDAARRLQEALQSRVRELLVEEDKRPFYEYREAYFPPGTIGAELAFVPSPLAAGPTPPQITGWFAWREQEEIGSTVPEVWLGQRALQAGAARRASETERVAREFQDKLQHEFLLRVLIERVFPFRDSRLEVVGLPIAAINLSEEQDVNCLLDELPALRELQNQEQELSLSSFELHFWREEDGTPRVVASRFIWIPSDETRPPLPSCFASFGRGIGLYQGFLIDPNWLFRDLPAALADQVLGATQRFLPPGAELHDPDADVFSIRPLRALPIELARDEDDSYGLLRVAVDVRDLEARFHTQTVRFLGVAAMLVLSLGTGLILLLRSVTRDLEAARRTENFVAAITHELRTPVAAIKLYGEMLDAGWVDSDERRREYYGRIVRETSRLETLVERVLEKAQLARREVRPAPGDLANVVEGLAPSLLSLAPAGVEDLAFELEPELPPVLLVPEGVRSIVTNLVENARKYAPVPPGGEPIRVVARRVPRGVLLEVLDRGPGIPAAERERIFDAFYRMGDERTRTARGTGLGLHLVALQAQAMGGEVDVRARPGGGTTFRILLKVAPAT